MEQKLSETDFYSNKKICFRYLNYAISLWMFHCSRIGIVNHEEIRTNSVCETFLKYYHKVKSNCE